ncbi:OFA family MFS transporter [Salipaludibacillus agaradhaerens]|uniref:OFA family MFS transporter n=1 Tax=Salipaludibacillus agaradhaerens TaxID=76935 RepID=A0A9Q4B3M5_SALAG|nr:OFA family MFS transporter [Salipaludibacillus agaradhaerens]MCR6097753.1 OFA family MFS transporter [Salipaludibacillus agaradhaerens]MCR6112763.1 OFA family MFS transporter [Salipaludibacillus agaradhaerens]
MNRWLVVLGAVIIQINLGAVYAWSLFNQPLMDKFGWDREAIVLTFSITIATFALMTILAGKLQDKIGPRWVATTGGILLGLGLLLSSQATTITQLYLFYGVIGGAGIGMTYVCPLSACVKWFPEKRGLISGIAVAGFGLGGLIFQPIIRFFIENFGVSSTFMYVGAIYLVFVVAGAQLLKNPPIKMDMKGKEGHVALEESTHFSSKEMVKTYPFYLLWFMFLFGSMSGLMVISFAVDIGVEVVQLDVEKAVNAVMVIALFNAAGRIILGNISDRFGRVNTLMFIYGITAVTLLYMSIGYMNYPLFLGTVSVIGFCFGGFLSLFPSITADYYGTKNMGSNYGLMYQAYGVSAFAGPFIVKVFPFGQAFIVASLFCMLAMLMAKAVTAPVKIKEPTVYREEVINEK